MISINGRYRLHNISGIPRYATNIVKEFDKKHQARFKVISPNGSLVRRGLSSILWENIFLPLAAKNDVLWNPSGSGPIFCENTVTTIHDVSFMAYPEWFSREYCLYYRFLTERLVKSSIEVITISEFSKSEIIKYFPAAESKIKVIYNGASDGIMGNIGDVSDEKLRIVMQKYQLNGPYFFCLGTLEPRKNINRIIRGWQKANIYNECALVVGGAVDKGSVFSQINISGQGHLNIKFIGSVEECDLGALYSGSVAFIYGSLYEGFGLPPIEALASGTDVVVSDIPCLKEILCDLPLYYFDPYSENDIAEGVIYAYNHYHSNDEQRKVKNARLIMEKYSWANAAEEIWKILEKYDA